ncbi:MAG TPA: CAP domain-containing protein [Solirubrobacteraceae bacterium]|nr:CAP domain-containing protein [Solirubrobacteraceae bacterium]
MKRCAFLPALLAAGLLAGCGSTGDPAGPAGSGAAPVAHAGALTLDVTDGKLGGAVTDTSAGPSRDLATGGRIDPDVLRGAPNLREGVAAGDACTDATLQPDAGNLSAVTAATLCLLNGERADRGLAALATDARLQRAALAHGNDMVERLYFAHAGRNGSQPAERIRAAGYLSSGGAWRIGENLAWGTGALATPRAIVSAWMASPGHRANILQPAYREIGFGVVAGNPAARGTGGATFVTEFGVVERATQTASRRVSSGSARRADRAGKRRTTTRTRTRRGKARRARARAALAPRSRRGRVVGNVATLSAGLR